MGSNRIITIARQYGSGGKTVGQMLAKDLGIDCYDREILRMASDDSGLNLQMFGNPDERRRNTFLTRAIKKVYKGEVIPPDSDDFASSDNLFNYQAKILKELAEQESYVVIGRCADFILRDNPNVVSVFIHAPFDYCVDRGLEKQRRNTSRRQTNRRAITTCITQANTGPMHVTMISVWTAASWGLRDV